MTQDNIELWLLAGFVAIIFFFGMLAVFVRFWMNFSRELKYLNGLIKYNKETERSYWIQQRRKLLLSLLPFIKYR